MALHDPDEAPAASSKQLQEVHKRALARFDSVAIPQQEIRAHALLCRRFIAIPGAMWEGPWGDQFENSIKVEIDKLSKGVEKIIQDYRANRIVPDFRPSGGDSDQDTADTLDGLHRADSYHFSAQEARDNAFEEGVIGGFGAWRLANEYADPADRDNDEQRVNPGLPIVDADQRVFFGPSTRYDKSTSEWAFVLTADARADFEEAYPGKAVDWPDPKLRPTYDWFAPEVVVKAEYYEVEEKDEKLFIFTQILTGDEERWWEDELDAAGKAELRAKGYKSKTSKRSRKRVRKYVMNGAEVLEDCGYIAGENIPVVPFYYKRSFVDNQERFRGYVSKRLDAQRIYNAKVSKLSETDSLAPREKPIFLAEQMPPKLQALWKAQEIERHPYALVNPVMDPVTGGFAAMGPIGKIEPPQLQPVTAALLQIANNDLTDETDDGADEVKANTSVDAMDFAATRTDAKSDIPLDNMKNSTRREGEIYLLMAKDCYFEPGRVVETMSEDGDDGEATLVEPFTDKQGVHKTRNNFSVGRYKVIADVTEATATRRDKTVRSCLGLARIFEQLDPELAQAAGITAVANMDGEGMTDLQKFARKKGVAAGVIEPNEQEQAEMQQEQQQPDPTQAVAAAEVALKDAQAQKATADAEKSHAGAVLNLAQAHALGGPEQAPAVPDGLEAAHKIVQIRKDAAAADNLETQTAHLPQKLAIEGANARTNRIKAVGDRVKELFKRRAD